MRRRVGILRQEAESRGDVAAWQRADFVALEPHRAAGWRPQPGQRSQQQGLAGAVAAEQRNEVPAPKHAVELVDQRASWHRDTQIPGLENCIHHLALIQRISSAVASPTRTSASDSGISKLC